MRLFSTLLKYWHLLSLDAPTVAALWCWAFGRAARARLAPWMPLALALGTWLFYVADRLLDARFSPQETLRERHHFHLRYLRRFLSAAVPVTIVLGVCIARMPYTLLRDYCVLGALSLLYLAAVHWPRGRRGGSPSWFPKELAVALLFAGATALPAWDEARRLAAGMPRHHPLLLLCPLFAVLCWLNCIAIEEWESTQSGIRTRLLSISTLPLSAVCLLALSNPIARLLAILVGVSALLFVLLDRSWLTPIGRRIGADLALLTPLFLLVLPGLKR